MLSHLPRLRVSSSSLDLVTVRLTVSSSAHVWNNQEFNPGLSVESAGASCSGDLPEKQAEGSNKRSRRSPLEKAKQATIQSIACDHPKIPPAEAGQHLYFLFLAQNGTRYERASLTDVQNFVLEAFHRPRDVSVDARLAVDWPLDSMHYFCVLQPLDGNPVAVQYDDDVIVEVLDFRENKYFVIRGDDGKLSRSKLQAWDDRGLQKLRTSHESNGLLCRVKLRSLLMHCVV
jgi:hypothetical protein